MACYKDTLPFYLKCLLKEAVIENYYCSTFEEFRQIGRECTRMEVVFVDQLGKSYM
jgi:hypothetical protein